MSSRSTTRRDDAPHSLGVQLLAYEHDRHADRLADIERMGARLALLDAFMPALAAASIVLDLDDVREFGGRTIYLGSGGLDHARNAKLVNVLLAGGMRVKTRSDHDFGTDDVWIELVKGRLHVSLSVDVRSKHLLELPPCV